MSNLLNKASIVLTPTAYSDGSLNTVIPPYGVLPTELVTNGTFDTDSSWAKTNAVISGGVATITVVGGAYSLIGQSITYQSGKIYKLTAQVQGTSGKVCTFFDNGSNTGGLGTSNGVINFDGSLQNVNITFTANSNSNQLLVIRNGSGDYSFTIDNVSVKEIQEADFDFSRGSSATRVNEQGLVEDVQILSGELVQNGDFEQIGSELVTNGNFDTDSDWIKETGWTISDGKANKTNTVASNFAQLNTGVFTNNNIYKITFTISNSNDGRLLIYIGGNSVNIDITNATNGTHTFYGKADGQDYLIFRNATSGFQGSIDNVSVKEVGQNWTVANDDTNNYVEFNQDEGTVRLKFLNTSPLTTLSSDTQYLSGKKYKLTVDVKEVVSGSVKIDAAGVSQTYNSVGVQEAIIEPTGNSNISFYRATADVDITLNSVSLIEITDDTDLPRIDYTDGTGSLLLEPQRTNKITYSEDFSDSSWNKAAVSLDSGYLAPDGTNTAFKVTGTTGNLYFGGVLANDSRSIWAKTVSGTGQAHLCSYFGNTNNTFTITNEWQRFIVNGTTTSTGAGNFYSIDFRGDTDLSEIILWGAQCEVGDYATSYIPTSGSTVTRSADVANNSGNADLFNDSEGVLYAEIAIQGNAGNHQNITASDSSTNNYLKIIYLNNTNKIRGEIKGGGSVEDIDFTNIQFKQFYKVAISYKSSEFKMFVDGTQIGNTITSFNLPTGLSGLAFDRGDGQLDFHSKTKCLAVFKEALSDTELACLTSQG